VTFTDEEWALIVQKVKVRQAKAGEYILQAGDVCDIIGLVNSGIFSAIWLNEVGKQRSLYFFFKDSPISLYTSFLKQVKTNAYLQCLSDGEFVYLTWQDNEELMAQIPSYERMVRISTEFLTIRLTQRMSGFYFLSAEERYKRLVEEQPDIFQKLPLNLIAEYINIEPQSLSRIRKRLSKSSNK
jgi:CRP-like cAMP-binding protein